MSTYVHGVIHGCHVDSRVAEPYGVISKEYAHRWPNNSCCRVESLKNCIETRASSEKGTCATSWRVRVFFISYTIESTDGEYVFGREPRFAMTP